MPPVYGGTELVPTDLGIGDIVLQVEGPLGGGIAADYVAPPTWTYGLQTYTGIEEIEAAKAKLRLATLYQYGGGATFDYDPAFGEVAGVWETAAKKYVDWYEEQTPTERIIEEFTDIGTGTGQEIEDILTGTIAATGGAVSGIIEPLAKPTGEFLESLILPAAAVAGLYIFLK